MFNGVRMWLENIILNRVVLDRIPEQDLERMLSQIFTTPKDAYIDKLVGMGEIPRSVMGLKAKRELDQAAHGEKKITQERMARLTKLTLYVKEAEQKAGTAKPAKA